MLSSGFLQELATSPLNSSLSDEEAVTQVQRRWGKEKKIKSIDESIRRKATFNKEAEKYQVQTWLFQSSTGFLG
jgi:hypothetical protein